MSNEPTLPTGTVTFLLSDVVGSTTLWEQEPLAANAAMLRHDALIEALAAHHSGVVVRPRGEGDSRFVAFARASDAVNAAAAIQQALWTEPWPTATPLRVRMALHTGEAAVRDGDYYGSAVNRCARLRSIAHGGQTLLSAATAELVRDTPPFGAALRDLGMHRLRDLTRPEHVYQLTAPGMPAAFPALPSLSMLTTNLPLQLTELVGREREIADLCALLRQPGRRLVTVTGPGGVGKTRLALQSAAELLDTFADGVTFVGLAALRDPSQVVTTIAQTLGLRDFGERPPHLVLQHFLHGKHMLLVLDNCEHLLDAAPEITDILTAATQVHVLATSRVRLRLLGEYEFPLSPFPIPTASGTLSLERLTQYESVRLFIERAQAVQPTFTITNATAPAVAEICARLDGLPLAIELAAVRSKLFSPPALLERLHRRLPMLTGGARDLPARQQTLRQTITWSYELLAEHEQVVFRRLAVFVGGWELEAAEALAHLGGANGGDTLDVLTALVDHNLVYAVQDTTVVPRFGMLETIREYALEQLEAAGEVVRCRAQHVEYFVAHAEQIQPLLRGPEQARWRERLERDLDNVRATLQTCLEDKQGIEQGLRLAVAMYPLWHTRALYDEGQRWLTTLLARRSTTNPTPAQVLAFARAVDFAYIQFRSAESGRLGDEGLALARTLNDPASLAEMLMMSGAFNTGEREVAIERLNEGLALYQSLGNLHGVADCLSYIGHEYINIDGEKYLDLSKKGMELYESLGDRRMHALSLGSIGNISLKQKHLDKAQEYFEKSLLSLIEQGDVFYVPFLQLRLGLLMRRKCDYKGARLYLEMALKQFLDIGILDSTWTMHELGELAYEQNDEVQAIKYFEQVIEHEKVVGANVASYMAGRNLGHILLAYGDHTRAAELFTMSLVRSRELMDVEQKISEFTRQAVLCLLAFAGLAAVTGHTVKAATLLASHTMLTQNEQFDIGPCDRSAYERYLELVRSQLDDVAFDGAWTAGASLSLSQAVEELRPLLAPHG